MLHAMLPSLKALTQVTPKVYYQVVPSGFLFSGANALTLQNWASLHLPSTQMRAALLKQNASIPVGPSTI